MRKNPVSLFGLIFFLTTGGFVLPALGISSTETLPKGIASPSLRMGSVDGIEERYAGDGKLYRLGDLKSMTFDAQSLGRLNKKANDLIAALNQFGTQELGNKLNLGILRISTAPHVGYFAPVFGIGMNDRWTLGVGVPVVHYENKISLSQEGSNLQFYRSQLTGLSDELDRALNTDLAYETQSTLSERGYAPLNNKNETFIGDIQLISLFRFWEARSQALLWQTTLGLPTGPRYNSDDLAAINIFGRTVLENRLVFSQKINSLLRVNPYVGYQYTLQTSENMRVPKDEQDMLPDQSSKEDVQRKIGDSKIVGTDLQIDVSEAWAFGLGYEFAHKDSDTYKGGKKSRYDLLSSNSDSDGHRVQAQVSYNTIKSYLKKQSVAPGVISLAWSDVVAGRNVERRTIEEISIMMFF